MIRKPQNLPKTTGVYFFKKGNIPLYIGKSVNIRARISSHFENARLDIKEKRIIEESDSVAYQITDSEFKALILESKLIQKYRPKYNIIWKDDKHYLYVKITVKEQYPKIYLVRKENDKKSRYFGPFSSVQTITEILRGIRKIFPYCSQKKIGKHVCFYSKINLCSPCPSYIEKQKTNSYFYKKLVRQYRSNIRDVVNVLSGKTEKVLSHMYKQMSVLSHKKQYEKALLMRNYIYQFETLIYNTVFGRYDGLCDQSKESIEELIQLLTDYYPKIVDLNRIECYDMSNFSFQEPTASMVVLTNGLIDKTQYRRFHIKNKKNISDTLMIKEVLERRFKRNNYPDLIVIDGGKPQVSAVNKIVKNHKIIIPVIGIAKNPDRIIIGTQNLITIRPSIHNKGFNIIRMLRNESHRFAKKYHVYLRKKRLMIYTRLS